MKKTSAKNSIKIPSKSKTIKFEKAKPKPSLKKYPAKKKVIEPSFDEVSLDKDLKKVLKKYNITNACFIASVPTSKNKAKRIVSTFNPNQEEEENALLDSMMNLLNKINLVSGDIDAICQLVDIAKANEKQVADLNEGKHLSKKEKEKMLKIREIKNKLVKCYDYEGAQTYREVEKQMLSGKNYDKKLVDELIKKG